MRRIPALAIPRLSQYYRAVVESREFDLVSSERISELTGYTAAQVRRDLTYFGQFGTPGRGYRVADLKVALLSILGIDQEWNVCLVGVGNLGSALLGYKGFQNQGFRMVAAFDANSARCGRNIFGVPIYEMGELESVVRRENIRMGIITVPAESAQSVAESLIRVGVKSLINFAPTRLRLPEGVAIHNIDMAMELERLSFLSRQKGILGLKNK